MKINKINEDRVMVEFSNTIDLETRRLITAYEKVLKDLPGIISLSCSYNQMMIRYDENIIDIEANLHAIDPETKIREKNIIRIPVCYDQPYALDIDEVCQIHNIDKATLIAKHTKTTYPVFMMGFVPGFPYLGHLDPDLETPRKKNPRTKIPKGSVGIGGKQTGIYPCASPGGWQIIGQTPIDLLDIKNNDTLIHRGDYVEFYQITKEEFQVIKAGDPDGN